MADLPPQPDDVVPMPLPDDDFDDDDLDELVTTDIRHSNAGVVHVGQPPSDIPSDWVMTTVYFHGFADLPHERGSFVTSSNFHCLGHEWCLDLYPGGVMAEDDEENVSLYLIHMGKGSVTIEFGVDVRGFTDVSQTTHVICFKGAEGTGYLEFLKRENALAYLVKGALVLEVWMRLFDHPTTWIPKNPSSNVPSSLLGQLFMDETSADVIFEVGGEQPGQGDKKSLNKFYAHRLILRKYAQQLADFCMTLTDDTPTVIKLPEVSAVAFMALLQYIYGRNIFNIGKDIARIKEILEVADKFGVVNLKLEMEELLVSYVSLDVDNFIDHLTYAESKNCALLKESVMDFIINSWKDIHASKKVANIPDALKENLLNDVMMAVAIKIRVDNDENEDRALDTMSIRELRQKADAQGLGIDGSRETLIALLDTKGNYVGIV